MADYYSPNNTEMQYIVSTRDEPKNPSDEPRKGTIHQQMDAIYIELEKFKEKRQTPRCTMCNAEKPSICGSCGASAYCSKVCQVADWPLHKLLCKAYRPFLATRPDARHKLGLKFPVLGEKPSLVWVPTKQKSGSVKQERPYLMAGRREHCTDLGLLMGAEYEGHPAWPGNRNLMRDFDLPYRLVGNFLKDAIYGHFQQNQPGNHSIMKLTEDYLPCRLINTLSGGFWRGPVIVTREVDLGDKYRGPDPGTTNGVAFAFYAAQELQQQDCTLADLRHAVDCFAKLPQIMTHKDNAHLYFSNDDMKKDETREEPIDQER